MSTFIAVTSADSGTGTVTSINVPISASALVGDLAILVGYGINTGVLFDAPPGWTQASLAAYNGSTTALGVWYKTLEVGEPGGTVTLSTGALSRAKSGAVYVVRGARFEGINTPLASGTAATSIPTNGYTPVADNCRALNISAARVGVVSTAATQTPPTGFTEQLEDLASPAGTNFGVLALNDLVLTGGAGVAQTVTTATWSAAVSSATAVVTIADAPIDSYDAAVAAIVPAAFLRYKFDEDSGSTIAVNSGIGGSALNGTASSSTMAGEAALLGDVGKSYFYASGAGQEVQSATAGAQINGLTSLTALVWFKLAEITGNDFLIDASDAGVDAGLSVRFAATNRNIVVNLAFADLTRVVASTPASSIATNTTYFLVVTWQSGSNLKIYLNGQLQTVTVAIGTINATGTLRNPNDLHFGKWKSNVEPNNLSGWLDDTTLAAAYLTDQQVQTLYTQGITPHGAPGEPGTTLQANMNRLAGTTNMDAQGAANVWAGTVDLDLNGALNAKAGTTGLELQGVLNLLAETQGLGVDGASSRIIG